MNPLASSTLRSTSSRRGSSCGSSREGSPRPGPSRQRSRSPCARRAPPRTNIPAPVARPGRNPRRQPRPRPRPLPRPVTNVVAVPVELVATVAPPAAATRPVQRVAPMPRPVIACIADVVEARLCRHDREELQALQRNVAAMRTNLTNMQEYRRNFVMDAVEGNEQLVMANLSQMMELNQRRPRQEVEAYAPLDAEEQPSAFSFLDDTPSLLNQSFINNSTLSLDRSYRALDDEEAPSGFSDIEDYVEQPCRNNATYAVNPRNNATYAVNPRNNATYAVNPRNNATYVVNRSCSRIEDEEAPSELNDCIDDDLSDPNDCNEAPDRSFHYLDNDGFPDADQDPGYLSFVAGLSRCRANP